MDKKRCVQLSSQSDKVYNNTMNLLKMVLNIERVLDVRELCIKLGCEGLVEVVNSTMEQYQRRYDVRHVIHSSVKKALTPELQGNLQFNTPIMTAAMVCVTAHMYKVE